MTLDEISRLLIALAACDWLLTAVIYMAARRVREPALTERASTSVILSVIATLAALLGANRLGLVVLPTDAAIGLLAFALALVSAPQFIWVGILAMGKFR